MSEADSKEFWTKVYEVRDVLIDRVMSHPEVTLVDIAYESNEGKTGADETTGRVVLQVHVRRQESLRTLHLPEEIDGVPIRMVVGDYKAE